MAIEEAAFDGDGPCGAGINGELRGGGIDVVEAEREWCRAQEAEVGVEPGFVVAGLSLGCVEIAAHHHGPVGGRERESKPSIKRDRSHGRVGIPGFIEDEDRGARLR